MAGYGFRPVGALGGGVQAGTLGQNVGELLDQKSSSIYFDLFASPNFKEQISCRSRLINGTSWPEEKVFEIFRRILDVFMYFCGR